MTRKALGLSLLIMTCDLWAADVRMLADETAKEVAARLNEGKTVEAEALIRRLLAQETAAKTLESPETLRAYDLLLEVFVLRADRSAPEVDEVGTLAIALREKLQGPDSLAVAQTLRLWAAGQIGRGNYSGARALVDRSVKIFEKAEASGHVFSRFDTAQYSRAVSTMAGVLAFMMDWHGAKRAVLKSIDLKRKLATKSAGMAASYLNLGRLEHLLGNDSEALAQFRNAREALSIDVKAGNPLLSELSSAEGRCLFETGNRAQGLAMVEQAVAAAEVIHGVDDTSVGPMLDNLAELYRLDKRFADAKRLLERGVIIARKGYGPLHPDVSESEAHLAQVLAETGEAKASLEHALEAEKIAREHLSLSVATLPEREATLFAVKRLSALQMAVSAVVDGKDDRVEAVFDALVRSRSIVFDELAARHRVHGSVSEDSELISRLVEELRGARERLARLALAKSDRSERLQQALEARDELDRRLAAVSFQYRRQYAGKSAGLKEVAALLPQDSAMVSFIRFAHTSKGSINEPPEMAAFVLNNGFSTVVALGSEKDISAAVDEMRARLAAEAAAPGIAVKRNEAAYRLAAEKLRKLIWDPIDRQVASTKRIFIVPDGSLHMVNFAALPEAGTDSHYLVERGMLFHYLSAERDLVTQGSLDASGVGLLAVGNPSFNRPELARGKTAGGKNDAVARNSGPVFRGARSNCSAMQSMQFSDLPASAKEVENISRLWKRGAGGSGDVVELTGELAGPERFKALAPGRRTIHLAVHGFVAGTDCTDPLRNENPLLLTGLALAGANRRGGTEDGILTAEEIASLDLRGVEWAVLSACDTGLGKTTPSEGVFGLRRAFQIAGAHTVIMSLWPVEDKVTTDWMQLLYEQRLGKQMDTAHAVRTASVEMLKKRRAAGQGTHPFYWAPFVAVGDWR